MRTANISGIACLALLTTCVAGTAATLIPVVPVSGSTSTVAFGINDSNIIAGFWFDSSSIEHGFFGTLAGSYTTFDYSSKYGNTGTEPRGINDSNVITGWGPGAANFVDGPEFEYNTASKIMKTITESGTALDGIPQGIAKSGTFTGDHWVTNNGTLTNNGYLGRNAKWRQDLAIFGSPRVAARGVNKSGTVVGFFLGGDGYFHGFILQNGTATQVNFPAKNEQDTYLSGINDKGLVSGGWDDNSGDGTPYAFKLDTTTNTFTSIKIKGSTYQQALGLDNAGLIAVGSDVGNFIYCPKKPADCPGSDGVEIADGPGIRIADGLHLIRSEQRRSKPHLPPQAASGLAPKRSPGAPALP